MVRAKPKKAIKQLKQLLQATPLLKEIIVQSARYQEVMNAFDLGTIDFSEVSRERNKINFALVNLIEKIHENSETNQPIHDEVAAALEEKTSKSNTAKAKGDGNIIIQDVSDSTVKINQDKTTK